MGASAPVGRMDRPTATSCAIEARLSSSRRDCLRNELQRLLDLANHEPGYAPEFYRGLLTSDVFALVPEVGHGLEEGKLRFVMWRGADGSEIIPYFSSIPLLENALQPGWQGVKLTGRYFLELTRGATVVLDPNEAAYCRLLPTEVTLLLETGAVSNPQRATPTGEPMRAFQAVDTPPTDRKSVV